MTNRWNILALLFCVRMTMAVQFQAVAALSPVLMNQYGIGLADIGLLIGLYLSPGIIIALPGGAIAQRFGDKHSVAFGLVLMFIGSLIILFLPHWEAQIAGRLLAGVGGVILNVLMSKMVTDWFDGHKLATAMGIYVNSWPLGIAATLIVLPLAAEAFGVFVALALVSASIALGLVALLALYQSPPNPAATRAATGAAPESSNPAVAGLRGSALICLILAGSIWGLYNAALAMIFGFGPAMLIERDWGAIAASSTTSMVLWVAAISVPLGGVLADRLQRNQLVLCIGLVLFAVTLAGATQTTYVVSAFVVLGLVAGIPVGPIMALPSMVLQPENRARGLGLFFTIYYLAIFVGPVAGGWVAEWSGTADSAFYLGSAMLVVCVMILAAFVPLLRRAQAAAAVAVAAAPAAQK